MEVIKDILLSLGLSFCSMTWCYSCYFSSDGATVIAVSLIRPNTKPPPGTETPIKGTIKMIQVENSFFLLSLRFPCPFDGTSAFHRLYQFNAHPFNYFSPAFATNEVHFVYKKYMETVRNPHKNCILLSPVSLLLSTSSTSSSTTA